MSVLDAFADFGADTVTAATRYKLHRTMQSYLSAKTKRLMSQEALNTLTFHSFIGSEGSDSAYWLSELSRVPF